jgi:hypothetical protein
MFIPVNQLRLIGKMTTEYHNKFMQIARKQVFRAASGLAARRWDSPLHIVDFFYPRCD